MASELEQEDAMGTMQRPGHAAALKSGLMDIGRAARESGVSVKMIRHYEAIGLVPRAPRTSAGYRLYSTSNVEQLRLIKRARDLGFSTREIRELSSVLHGSVRAGARTRNLARKHMETLRLKASALSAMVDALQHLADSAAAR